MTFHRNIINLENLDRMLLVLSSCSAFAQAKFGADPSAHLITVNPAVPKKIVVQILDEYGSPTAARIRVSEQDSIYYSPVAHQVDLKPGEGGGDVILDYKRKFA